MNRSRTTNSTTEASRTHTRRAGRKAPAHQQSGESGHLVAFGANEAGEPILHHLDDVRPNFLLVHISEHLHLEINAYTICRNISVYM